MVRNTLSNLIERIVATLFGRKPGKATGNVAPALTYAPRPENEQPRKREVRFILSLDGGGINALCYHPLLKMMENEIKKRDCSKSIADAFDCIAGCGSGSIAALALAIPEKFNADSIYSAAVSGLGDFLTPEKSPFYKLPANKYSNVSLAKALRSLFGNRKISESRTETLVLAYDCASLSPAAITRKSEYSSLTFADAAEASCAYPTYFNAFQTKVCDKTRNLISGSTLSENPALWAAKYAKILFPNADEMRILSLASYRSPLEFKNTSAPFSWTEMTKGRELPIEQLMKATRHSFGAESMDILSENSKISHLRIGCPNGMFSDEIKPDSVSQHDIVRLRDIGNTTLRENSDALNEFMRSLCAEKLSPKS